MSRLVNPAQLHGKLFSQGWRTGSGGTIDTCEPATGRLLATVGLADASDVATAANHAVRAQPAWAATEPAERAAVLRRAAQVLEARAPEVVDWLIREGGGIRAKAEHEVWSVTEELWAAAALLGRPHGHLLPSGPERQSIGRRVPLGTVGVISPWNVPLLLGLRAVAPALALGNSVILKPDVHTPVSGGWIPARIFEEAGLPEGVLQVLPGDAEPGQALVAHPDVAMIAFTGSTAVGRSIGETAGRLLKRVSLELGGNNALIVLDDADLEVAASAGAWASFFHAGQICMSAGRHVVLESVADEYLDRLAKHAQNLRVGDPWRDDVDLGPLINEEQTRRVDRIVSETLSAGATLHAGGTRQGPFHRPTVLGGVTATMPAFREEIFGPVAPVVVVRDDDEAVAVANDTEYGLSAAVQTGSPERGLAVAERLHTGLVHVNDQTINDEAHIPFGGRGASGNGSRFGSENSWDEFTQWQWLTIRSTATRYPF